MENYSVVIAETSKELSAKERIFIKDVTDAVKLDEATKDGALEITVDSYAVLDIHNEKSDNKDYKNYVIVDTEGNKYVTGSQSFWNSFMNIYNEMDGVDEEWSIKIYRIDSKNYKGKQFLSCSII